MAGGIQLSGSLQGGGAGVQQTSGGFQQPSTGIQVTGVPLQQAANFSPISTGQISQNQASVNASQQQNSDQTAQVNALLASLKAQQNAYAPPLNLTDIYNQASTTAQANVNPYYTKQLNDFVAQQAQAKAQQQQQTQMNIQNLQDQLTNTLAANQTSGARTAQDTLANEQQAGIKADQTQQDQGTQFDQARIAQAKQLAGQNITTSGTGAQQVLGSETDRNTQEARQAADLQQQNQQAELLKSRTFEDLATSGALAQQTETKGETQANFDLNNYIQGQASDLTKEQGTLEQQRLQQVGTETTNQAKLLVDQFIQSISNPAQRAAAAAQYAGAF